MLVLNKSTGHWPQRICFYSLLIKYYKGLIDFYAKGRGLGGKSIVLVCVVFLWVNLIFPFSYSITLLSLGLESLWLGFKMSLNLGGKIKSLFLLTFCWNSISFHYELWNSAFPFVLNVGKKKKSHGTGGAFDCLARKESHFHTRFTLTDAEVDIGNDFGAHH